MPAPRETETGVRRYLGGFDGRDMLGTLPPIDFGALPHDGSALTYVRTERYVIEDGDMRMPVMAERRVSYSCEQRLSVGPPTATEPNAFSGPSPIIAWSVAASALTACLGLFAHMLGSPATPVRTPLVTLPIEPAKMVETVSRTPVMITVPRQMVPKPATSLVVPIERAAPQPVADRPAPVEDDMPAYRPVSVEAALARAFKTNEMENWDNGFVVVGPAELINGLVCRDVAVLTRADGRKDATVNSRRCQTRAGRMLPASATLEPAPNAAPLDSR